MSQYLWIVQTPAAGAAASFQSWGYGHIPLTTSPNPGCLAWIAILPRLWFLPPRLPCPMAAVRNAHLHILLPRLSTTSGFAKQKALIFFASSDNSILFALAAFFSASKLS